MNKTDNFLDSSPEATGPFRKWSECRKALVKLPTTASVECREALVRRIESSPQRLQIAFEGLCWMRDPNFPPRLHWIKMPLLFILGGGDAEPEWPFNNNADEARNWIFRELREVRNKKQWERFVSNGRHLWILNAILRASGQTIAFLESVVAFAECTEHCLDRTSDGKPKSKQLNAASTQWVADLLKANVPTKLALPPNFFAALFAVNATAGATAHLRDEVRALQLRLKQASGSLEDLRKSEASLRDQLAEKIASAAAIGAAIRNLEAELENEKLHAVRQGGFNVIAKREMLNKVMSHVRQNTTHRLENIIAYADRENPDKKEIVALVKEIQKHLSGVEENLIE